LIKDLFNVPNSISIVRLALIPVFVWMVVDTNYGWAGVLLGVIGATDWVDGYLARRLGQVTEIGKLLDPLADRIAVFIAVVAGLWSGVLPAAFGWALLIREALIALGALYGWMKGVTKLDVRYIGKVATFAVYTAVAGFYIGNGFGWDWMVLISWVIGVPGLVLYYIVAVQYVGDMRRAIGTNS
jgi:cardiolipin synthase (CMP-forming)